MDDDAISGAMTEVALALAMAFFCLFVLALMSMGMPAAPHVQVGDAVRLQTGEAGGAQPRPIDESEHLVLFHAGRFLDRDGGVVDPAATVGRVVLAVDPALPLDQVLAARSRFTVDVVVSPLDPGWVDHLSGGGVN